ncbi:MAG: GAF domain-containing protein [Lentisphaeria bacterium]|nr:GAF domain-containing protein [Lentisphaeria bacterium]
MAKLQVVSEEWCGEIIEIGEGIVIGRDAGADLCVPLGEMSRRHFRVYACDGHYLVEDLGSRNGTLVNDKLENRLKLSNGDRVRVGSFEVVFVADSPAEAPTMPQAGGSQTAAGNVSVSLDASSVLVDAELDRDQAVKRLEAYYAISTALAVESDEEKIFTRILECILEVFPQSSRAYVLTGDSVDSLVERGRLSQGGTEACAESAVSRTILAHAIEEREAVLSLDAGTDDRFAAGASVIQQNIHTMMCTPLIVNDEILGILEVDSARTSNPFRERDLQLLVAIARQIALFFRNLTLVEHAAAERIRRHQLEVFFSPAVAQAIVRNQLSLGGELRTGVIMFCDIVGFTPMSERTDAAELVRLLNMYLGLMVSCILEKEGTIDKFGGDAILAVWGAPTNVDRGADRALSAAIDMQNEMVGYNSRLKQEGVEGIGMGLGLHAGDFIAGNIGSDERMEYTVIGNHVNIAQRIESMADRDVIMASEDFCHCLEGSVCGTRFPSVSLKGASQPMPLVCIRGLFHKDGVALVSAPVTLDGDIGGKVVRVNVPLNRLGLLVEGEVPPGIECELAWRMPECEMPPIKIRIQSCDMQNETLGALTATLVEGEVGDLFSPGIKDAQSPEIPWHRGK